MSGQNTVRMWLILLPPVLWLATFLGVPLVSVFRMSFSADPLALKASGWSLGNFASVLSTHLINVSNSLLIGSLSTLAAFGIAVPTAYGIAFFGGRWRAVLLFVTVAPFLTSYLIRVISWQTLLGANGPIFTMVAGITGLQVSVLGTPFAVVAGLTYQLVPFVLLPIYAAFSRIDPNICDAADDLYSTCCGWRGALAGSLSALFFGFLAIYVLTGRDPQLSVGATSAMLATVTVAAVVGASVTERFAFIIVPLSRNGFLAAAVLTFIPALGDYVNAALLGNIRTQMIGNVIQAKFLVELDYADAAALSSLLLVLSFALLGVFLKIMRGSEVLDAV